MTTNESFEQLYDSYPGEAASCSALISDALAAATRLAQLTGNLTDAELTSLARSLALVHQQTEATLVAVTTDAIERGAVYRSTAADATQWVRRLSTGESTSALMGAESVCAAGPLVPTDEPHPEVDGEVDAWGDERVSGCGLEPAQASRIAKIADAVRSPLNAPLAEALQSGRINTTIAKTCLDNIDKIKAVLPKAGRDEIYGWLLTFDAGAGAKTIRELTKRILAQYGDEVLDQAEDQQQKVESLSWCDVVVTIDFLVLAGILAGLGITDTDIGVSPDTVRQLAGDADILPMVLGSKNQPLNIGRKKRLVEDELRRAVIHRDKHCTYAGCDRPPVMCDVHHVESWWAGGDTSLANSALLCSTHHRIVHRDHLTATVTDTGVTWHYAHTETAVA